MSIEIFEHANFTGRKSGALEKNYPSVGDAWNDKISSIKVYSGTWEFYEHINFQGRSLQLGPGEYPSFNNQVNDTISSFKKVAANDSSAQSDEKVVTRILELTNMERRKASLPPLTLNSQLTAAAQKHSQSMAQKDFFDHRNMADRVRAEGYQYSLVAENISAGSSTPEDAMQGWMNSPGHRANILKPALQELGVGYYFLENDQGRVTYKHYWVQMFGTPL